MDVKLIEAFNLVIEDIEQDPGLALGNKAVILNTLKHRVWELENWEQFSLVEEE